METLKAWSTQELWVALAGVLGGATTQQTAPQASTSLLGSLVGTYLGTEVYMGRQRHYLSPFSVLYSLTSHNHHRAEAAMTDGPDTSGKKMTDIFTRRQSLSEQDAI